MHVLFMKRTKGNKYTFHSVKVNEPKQSMVCSSPRIDQTAQTLCLLSSVLNISCVLSDFPTNNITPLSKQEDSKKTRGMKKVVKDPVSSHSHFQSVSPYQPCLALLFTYKFCQNAGPEQPEPEPEPEPVSRNIRLLACISQFSPTHNFAISQTPRKKIP